MADIDSKREEFSVWLNEVKRQDIEKITHSVERKFLEEYMEDYNTVTFPSKKYYDLKKWHEKLIKKGKVDNGIEKILNDEADLQYIGHFYFS